MDCVLSTFMDMITKNSLKTWSSTLYDVVHHVPDAVKHHIIRG
jgi:hypothetical protein